jgi:septum formation protein
MARLVLASTSAYRRALMDRLGLPYLAVAPSYEEEHDLALSPAELVQELAVRKARSVARAFPDALIVGADQLAEIDGERLFKPGTVERAVEQLLRLGGRTHRLVTGLAVLDARSGRIELALDVQLMTLRPLTAAQARAYVAKDSPLDCAGAYRIEGQGIALFESMRGEDYSAIIGLPLTKLVTLLGRFGIDPLRAG